MHALLAAAGWRCCVSCARPTWSVCLTALSDMPGIACMLATARPDLRYAFMLALPNQPPLRSHLA